MRKETNSLQHSKGALWCNCASACQVPAQGTCPAWEVGRTISPGASVIYRMPFPCKPGREDVTTGGIKM